MKVALILPGLRDPAHRAVARGLGGALRRRGHRVSILAGDVGLGGRLAAGGFDAACLQWFSRGLGRLGPGFFPSGLRLIVVHQGASVDFIEHPRAFRRILARADRVAAVSSSGLKDLLGFYPGARSKAAVIPNGTPALGPTGPRVRRARPYILTVGRIAAYKGLDVLAMAFVRLAAETPDLDWIACGPDQSGGEFRRFIRRLGLAKRVTLPGTVSRARAAALMRGCLCFAMPSRAENHPLALLEAMSAGCAIAASRTGGIAETLRRGREGLLVPPGMPGPLLRALRTLVRNGAVRLRLGRAAEIRSREFHWDRAAGRYEDLLGPMTAVTNASHGGST